MTSRVIPRPDGNGFDTVPVVVVANPTTGAAVPDITRGGGAIDANTQRVTLATDDPGVAALASIDGKTPALVSGAVPTTDSKGGTRQYDFSGNVWQAVTSTSTTAVVLPTLYASREVMAHSSERCFVRFGDSSVSAATVAGGQLILEPGERFHLRLAAGVTHFRAIRDTTDGNLSITAVVL